MENFTFSNIRQAVLSVSWIAFLFIFSSQLSFGNDSLTIRSVSVTYTDTDGDGVPDGTDVDDDNDGIIDAVEDKNTDGDDDPATDATDTDGDGIPNYLDIDSDNDGILDNVEAQTTVGFIAPCGIDTDGNGLDDHYEETPGSCDGLTPIDTDEDGIPDYLDIDSDDDGILDNVEAQTTADFQEPCGLDTDGNGLDDHYEEHPGSGDGITPVDTDGDSHPDFRDIDSDDDGILDNVEAQTTEDFIAVCDNDTDGNGLDDHYEEHPGSGDGLDPINSDNDSNPNFRDIDSDNDGLPDNVEAQTTAGYVPPSGLDDDDDGLDNAYEGSGDEGLTPVNTDGTDQPDYLDDDSDNDLVPDNNEGNDFNFDGIPDQTFTGTDTDGDGLDDGYEGSDVNDGFDVNDEIDDPANDLPDTDGTEDVNYRDFDDDGDGIDTPDEDANNNNDPTDDDTDNDGTPDYLDPDTQAPNITVLKVDTFNDENSDGLFQVGETISYVFTVTNTGNVPLGNITVTDPLVTVSGGPLASLEPGAVDNTTFTAVYTLTQADVDAEIFSNSATVTGFIPDNGPISSLSDDPDDPTDNDSDGDGNPDDPTVTVPSGVPTIDAVDDDLSFSPVDGATGGIVLDANVLDNDTLEGVAVNPADVTITSTPTGPLTVNADGTVSVAAGTEPGTYTIEYTICENANPENCDTATVTVLVVDGNITINAVDDDFSASPVDGVTGGVVADANVLDNDTLEGDPVNPGEVIITSTPTGPLTVNADGTVSVAAGTASGTYTIQYTICEIANPENCDTATVTVVVVAGMNIIDAVDDDYSASPVDGAAGGDVADANVLDNDTLNGEPVDPADVTITSTPTGPLTVNTDGTVSVASGTEPGTYTIDYTICEVADPENCDTATVIVEVVAGANIIDAVDDDYTDIFIDGGEGGLVPDSNVLDNDMLNGEPVNPADVTITSTPTGPLTVNTDGTVNVASNTPTGSYTIDYTICEIANPSNCDTATVTVLVSEVIVLEIEVNQMVTPNFDGKNDFLFIRGVENALNNTLRIYNRWGIAVYEGRNYNNQNNVFDGRSKGRSTLSVQDYLPAGIYFYIFEYDFNQERITDSGYLYLSK